MTFSSNLLSKIRFFIHCANFSNHNNFSNIFKNLTNLVLLKSQDRLEYQSEKYFRIILLRRINTENDSEDENFQLFTEIAS